MTPTEVFSIAGMITMPMWILMIFLPKWKVTRFLIDFKIIPLLLSLTYTFYIFKAILIGGMMDFGSLTSVMALFTEENAVLAGWVHYLAFDLFVGLWIAKDADAKDVSRILQAPILLATFVAGPIGLFVWLVVREGRARAAARAA